MRNLLPALLIGLILACGMFTSCKKHINGPPEDTTHKCDTCCDTCKKDTTKPPCDTCNIDKDSAAHAFVWTEYVNGIPNETNITGVWVFGPNDIMICANSLYHFDGTNFTLIDESLTRHPTISANGGLNGFNIFAFSKTDFWLVNGIAFHSTDVNHIDDMRPPGYLNACWGTSSNDMFFVGRSGYIYHFDGTSFSQMTSNTTKDLRSVWGTSSTNVWACGYNTSTGGTTLIHYDGNLWSEDQLSITKGIQATGGFNAVYAVDSAGQHFVSTSGAILLRKTNNGLWRSDSGLIPNSLGGSSFIGIAPKGNSPNDMMVYGPWGFIAHWNGKTWKQYNSLFNYGNPDYFSSAFSINGNTACAVGEKSGQAWMAVGRRK